MDGTKEFTSFISFAFACVAYRTIAACLTADRVRYQFYAYLSYSIFKGQFLKNLQKKTIESRWLCNYSQYQP